MVREVMLAQCGILWDHAALVHWNVPVTVQEAFKLKTPTSDFGSYHQSNLHRWLRKNSLTDSRDGADMDSDERREQVDATQPMDDELKKNPLWWMVEVMPMKYSYQDESGRWVSRWWCVLDWLVVAAADTVRLQCSPGPWAMRTRPCGLPRKRQIPYG